MNAGCSRPLCAAHGRPRPAAPAAAAAGGGGGGGSGGTTRRLTPNAPSRRNAQLYELDDDDGWGVEVAPAPPQKEQKKKPAVARKPAAAAAVTQQQQQQQQQPRAGSKPRKAKRMPYVDLRGEAGVLSLSMLQQALIEQEAAAAADGSDAAAAAAAAGDSGGEQAAASSSQQQQPGAGSAAGLQAVKASAAQAALQHKRGSKKGKLPGFPAAGAAAAAAAAAAAGADAAAAAAAASGSSGGGVLDDTVRQRLAAVFAAQAAAEAGDDDDDEDEEQPQFEVTFDELGRSSLIDHTRGGAVIDLSQPPPPAASSSGSSALVVGDDDLDEGDEAAAAQRRRLQQQLWVDGGDDDDGDDDDAEELDDEAEWDEWEEEEEEEEEDDSGAYAAAGAAGDEDEGGDDEDEGEDDGDATTQLLRDLSQEDDWGLEGLVSGGAASRLQLQQQQGRRQGRRSLVDELAAEAEAEEALDGDSLAAGNAASVRWGGSAGATGIDLEEQEALLRRLGFRPLQVDRLMREQREIDANVAEQRRRAAGVGASDHKLQQKLRVVAGTAAGRKLVSFRSAQTRPMMEKVRQAVFNMVAAQTGAAAGAPLPAAGRWLDLFAGTGSVGLEALSRGVGAAHFVEMDPVVVSRVLSRNIAACGFAADGRAVTHTSKAEDFLRRAAAAGPRFAGGPFDFVSVCPPYLLVSYPELFDLLEASPLLHARSVVFVEYPQQLRREVRDRVGPLRRVRDRKYGRTHVALYAGSRAGEWGGGGEGGGGAWGGGRGGDEDEEEEEDDPFLASGDALV